MIYLMEYMLIKVEERNSKKILHNTHPFKARRMKENKKTFKNLLSLSMLGATI